MIIRSQNLIIDANLFTYIDIIAVHSNNRAFMTTKDTSTFDTESAHEDIIKLASYRMPFGKHAGQLLIDLPEPYVVWFHGKGFPEGELGRMLGITYEIKVNGLEPLFKPLLNR